MLLWKRYGNNKMAAMRIMSLILHLQHYSHRLNLFSLKMCSLFLKVVELQGRGSVTQSFQSPYSPGVDSASNRNDYQEYFLGVKAAGA